jgi:hypothetical protein
LQSPEKHDPTRDPHRFAFVQPFRQSKNGKTGLSAAGFAGLAQLENGPPSPKLNATICDAVALAEPIMYRIDSQRIDSQMMRRRVHTCYENERMLEKCRRPRLQPHGLRIGVLQKPHFDIVLSGLEFHLVGPNVLQLGYELLHRLRGPTLQFGFQPRSIRSPPYKDAPTGDGTQRWYESQRLDVA